MLGADAAGHVAGAACAASASSTAVAIIVGVGSIYLTPGVPL